MDENNGKRSNSNIALQMTWSSFLLLTRVRYPVTTYFDHLRVIWVWTDAAVYVQSPK